MSSERIPPLGITMGDPAGIGPEIIIKLFRQALPHKAVVFGDMKCLEMSAARLGYDVKFVEIKELDEVQEHCHPEICVVQCDIEMQGDFSFGNASAFAGHVSYQSFRKAIEYAIQNKIGAVVTTPINKHAWKLAGVHYPGHTDVLDEYAVRRAVCGSSDPSDCDGDIDGKHVSMMLLNDELRTILVTAHVALADVPKLITREAVLCAIMNAAVVGPQMGIATPRIAVAGLNPHAGEEGQFGTEEIRIISPAIEECRGEGIDVSGPYPADTIFMRARRGEFDIVVAMYHDQALIPVKYLGLDKGVNVTAGLPFVRTSVDHGTAYDIAGQGVADESSLRVAFDLALMMSNHANA